jgi:hypothetical protein
MSLTLVDTAMAAVHENGVNDFLAAFFNARRRHLVYGTGMFVSVTTAAATSISAMTFPGIPGGIDILVEFAVPTVDLDPDSSGGTSPLPPKPGQLAVRTTVRLTVACKRAREPNETNFLPLSTSLELFAIGMPVVSIFSPVLARFASISTSWKLSISNPTVSNPFSNACC